MGGAVNAQDRSLGIEGWRFVIENPQGRVALDDDEVEDLYQQLRKARETES